MLVDAGPLIALLDRSDAHHEQITDALKKINDPLVTVWPPLVEAMYLLASIPDGQAALWTMLETEALRLLPLDVTDVSRMKALMEKYRDLPMDMADAALVRVAEREGIRRIVTIDRKDFSVYRLQRRGRFTILP